MDRSDALTTIREVAAEVLSVEPDWISRAVMRSIWPRASCVSNSLSIRLTLVFTNGSYSRCKPFGTIACAPTGA